MNLENSLINQQALSVPATSLQPPMERSTDPNYISKCIEESLPYELRKFYELGFNYFKLPGNDSINFLKCFFNLFNDYFKTIIRESNVEIEKQDAVIENLNLVLKNIENNYQMIDNLLNSLKIQKKSFDSNKLFMIITGYAINNLNKNHRY